jgi:hypothetical protein
VVEKIILNAVAICMHSMATALTTTTVPVVAVVGGQYFLQFI